MNIGLIAGEGLFPLLSAKAARQQGHRVFSVGFKDITDPSIEHASDRHSWIGLGQLSKMLGFYKDNQVEGVILAGRIDHAHALDTKEKLRMMTDPRTLKLLLGVKERNANGLLQALIGEIESEGMRVLPSSSYLEAELLAPGLCAGPHPDAATLNDIQTGHRVAKALAGMDVGLTACVAQGAIVALEAMEGTDACIRRAGGLLKDRGRAHLGFCVVKVARPDQDPRYDLPVLGPTSIEIAAEAGARALAAQSGWTLLLDSASTKACAKRLGISLIGLDGKVI
ncbi:MAG: UDP-2,3-diacylglucosamine diphosphatase LpxI [Elusimicrobiota bacterium]